MIDLDYQRMTRTRTKKDGEGERGRGREREGATFVKAAQSYRFSCVDTWLLPLPQGGKAFCDWLLKGRRTDDNVGPVTSQLAYKPRNFVTLKLHQPRGSDLRKNNNTKCM